MKRLIDDNQLEGLEMLLGATVTFWCTSYIYTGTLVGVNSQFVKLSGASVVYETGELTSHVWKDAQKLPHDWYIMLRSIESFGLMK